MKRISKIKRKIAVFLIFLLSINSFGAIVSDNDGSAFVTKAEFDALKANFNKQIDDYNKSIDGKIDGAIASYLSGIAIAKTEAISTYGSGLWWSVGPFDRPRWKQSQPIICGNWVCTDSPFGKNTPTKQTALRDSAYWSYQVTWGDDWKNRKKPDNPATKDIYLGRQVISAPISGTVNKYNPAGGSWNQYEFTGYKGDVSQFLSGSTVQYEARGYSANSLSPDINQYADLHGEDAASHGNTQDNISQDSQRNKSGWNFGSHFKNGTFSIQIPFSPLQEVTGVSTHNEAFYGDGEYDLWNDNVIAFAPMQYSFFTSRGDEVNRDRITFRGYGEKYATDTRAYTNNLHSGGAEGVKNLFYYSFPDPDDDPDARVATPWSAPLTNDKCLYIYLGIKNQTNNKIDEYPIPVATGSEFYYLNGPVKWGYGYSVYSGYLFRYHWYTVPQMGMNVRVDNWNELFHRYDDNVNLQNSSSKAQAMTTNSSDLQHINLAAGLPLITAQKNGTINLSDITFRKSVDYPSGNKGILDDSDVYAVYVKKEPFDITKNPEDETDLLDVSTGDVDNKGKLTKCYIVRNGKINLNISLEKNDTLFIKWEKISNWNSARTVRNEGNATNQDTVVLECEFPTLTPKWTYFGGGIIDVPDKLNIIYED